LRPCLVCKKMAGASAPARWSCGYDAGTPRVSRCRNIHLPVRDPRDEHGEFIAATRLRPKNITANSRRYCRLAFVMVNGGEALSPLGREPRQNRGACGQVSPSPRPLNNRCLGCLTEGSFDEPFQGSNPHRQLRQLVRHGVEPLDYLTAFKHAGAPIAC
jgi:hypothetical protein